MIIYQRPVDLQRMIRGYAQAADLNSAESMYNAMREITALASRQGFYGRYIEIATTNWSDTAAVRALLTDLARPE